MTTFWPIFLLLFVYCNLYMPTMALSNSITFRSLGEANQQLFPVDPALGHDRLDRGGLSFAAYLDHDELTFYQSIFDVLGQHGRSRASSLWRGTVVPTLKPVFALPFVGEPHFRDCLRVSGVVSLLYALYCLTLPHTPPVPAKETDPIDKRSAVTREPRADAVPLVRRCWSSSPA